MNQEAEMAATASEQGAKPFDKAVEHVSFGEYMLKPSNVCQIWSGDKIHKVMFEYM